MRGGSSRANCFAGFKIVSRDKDRDIRDRPQGGQVVQGVVCASQGPVTHPCADANQSGRDIGITNVVLDLLQCTGRQETSGRNAKRFLSSCGKSGRDANQILLSDANFNDLLRQAPCQRAPVFPNPASRSSRQQSDDLVRQVPGASTRILQDSRDLSSGLSRAITAWAAGEK